MTPAPDDFALNDDDAYGQTPHNFGGGSGLAARALGARNQSANTGPKRNYLDGLNAEQLRAVETTEGPVLVLAGAGTGKTRVLTTRIAHILATGKAYPSQIFCVTFTNKAAREMRERIHLLVGDAVEGMQWLGTFHSTGVKFLRRHAELAGLKSGFTILDTDDVVRLIKQLITAEGIDEKRWPARQFAQMIDGWKNKGLGPSDIAEGDARAFGNGKGRVLFAAYQDRLKTLNSCDFGDLLCLPIMILRDNPDVLADYHRRFKYILVDEYQDTNTAQYMLLKLLAGRSSSKSRTSNLHPEEPQSGVSKDEGNLQNSLSQNPPSFETRVSPAPQDEGFYSTQSGRPPVAAEGVWKQTVYSIAEGKSTWPLKSERILRPQIEPQRGDSVSANQVNICVVGDDDQSIYGWRGAEIDNILRFEKDFPGALTIKLEQNYRSTAHILGASGHLIAHNEGRLGKTLFTDRIDPEDSKVMVHAAWDSGEEARALGEEIEQLQRKGHNLNTMAILVRASFQFREFEDRFIEIGLNYRVIGGPRFYERQEVRDALAYFRVCCQPADDLAFERIVNTPKRGLGESAIRQIHDYARAKRIPMLQAASELTLTDEMKPKPRHALRSLVDHFERWQARLDNTPHHELAEQMLDDSGYTEMWQNDRSDPKAPERLENLKELIGKMQDYESLRSFLEHVSLVMDAEQNANLDAVNIMTLHSAKGLEFDTVFLPGWEEGLFPHQRSLDEGGRSGLEEERRLAYVGLTRAKRRAHIWFVSNRRVHGMWQSTIPSRFLDELPAEHCDVVAAPDQNYGGYGRNPYGSSRFDSVSETKGGAQPFDAAYSSPGWQRAQANRTDATRDNWGNRSGHQVERIGYGETDSDFGAGRTSVKGRVMEGELVAKSVTDVASAYQPGDRVFHIKFGNGDVTGVEGNKLTILFDRAGEKRVLDGFVRGV